MTDAGSHGKLAHAVASHLRPAVLAEFDKAMAAVFVAGAEVRTFFARLFSYQRRTDAVVQNSDLTLSCCFSRLVAN